ncbi:hypothetical protein BaRGS_00004073 [Batillaria attramentaria]|uniref:Uncharacterized protein n=1 Tax=Batillaria attramentaria TaxID=370345 RepID=A0ABD0LYK9_9CAEN
MLNISPNNLAQNNTENREWKLIISVKGKNVKRSLYVDDLHPSDDALHNGGAWPFAAVLVSDVFAALLHAFGPTHGNAVSWNDSWPIGLPNVCKHLGSDCSRQYGKNRRDGRFDSPATSCVATIIAGYDGKTWTGC